MVKNTTLDTQNFPPINTNNIYTNKNNTKKKNTFLSYKNGRTYSPEFFDRLYANIPIDATQVSSQGINII